MRDTSHKLVINKHAASQNASDKSLLIAPHNRELGSHGGVSKSAKRLQHVSLGQGGPPPPTPASPPPVCLQADESITQTRAPQRRSHAPLSSLLAGAQITPPRLCTRRRGECGVSRGVL